MVVEPGKNFLGQVGFPTPNDIPETSACRTFSVPASEEWLGLLMGAVEMLMQEYNYYHWGALLPSEAAEVWKEIILEAYDNYQCAGITTAPFWDNEDGDDAEGDPSEGEGFPWYENLADWVVTAFLATGIGPTAAVEFVTTARKFRLLFRTRSLGGVARILLDGVLQGEVDTSSVSPGLTSFDVVAPTLFGFTSFDVPTYTLRIEADSGNTSEQRIEIIRKRLWEGELDAITDLRQNEDEPCTLEYTRDGETWTAFADLQKCPPLLFQVGGQVIIHLPDGGIVVPPEDQTVDERETEFTPPVRLDDPQCLAAANAANVIYTLHSQVVQTLTIPAEISIAAAIAGLLISLLFMPVAVGIILALFATGLGLTFIGLIVTLPPSAFTANIVCLLQQIFYDNSTDASGVVTFDFTTIRAATFALSDNNIWTCITFYLDVIGENGLNRAGATTAIAAADCSGCAWCYEWDFTEGDGGFVAYRGSYSAGVGFVAEVGSGFVAATIYNTADGSYGQAAMHWEVQMTMSGVAGNAYTSAWYLVGSSTFTPLGYMDYLGTPTYPGYGAVNGSAQYTFDTDPAYPGFNIGVNGVVNDEGATVVITAFRNSGTGPIPDYTGGHLC